MLSQAIQSALEDLIQDQINSGNTFTAFDLTRELRAQGFRVIHGEAKAFVHGFFLSGMMTGYTRELRGSSLQNDLAWTYYPINDPPYWATNHLLPLRDSLSC